MANSPLFRATMCGNRSGHDVSNSYTCAPTSTFHRVWLAITALYQRITHDHLPFRTTILVNPGIVPVLITSISRPNQPVRGACHKRRGHHRHSIGSRRQERFRCIPSHILPTIHKVRLTTPTHPLHKPKRAHHPQFRTHYPSTPTPP